MLSKDALVSCTISNSNLILADWPEFHLSLFQGPAPRICRPLQSHTQNGQRDLQQRQWQENTFTENKIQRRQRGEGIHAAKWDGKSRRTALLGCPICHTYMTLWCHSILHIDLIHYRHGTRISWRQSTLSEGFDFWDRRTLISALFISL